MNPIDSKEGFIEEINSENTASIDDFIRQLEEKEKDLHISIADSVVEIEDSDDYQDSEKLPKSVKGLAELNDFLETSYTPPQIEQNIQKNNLELVELRKQIQKLEKERQELREILTRRQNDFENYRKRNEREKTEINKNLVGDLVARILPVVDNLGRALDSANELSDEKASDFQDFINGIVLVNRQLNAVLNDMGVEAILAVGEQFDPNFHEAVAVEEDVTLPPNTVIEEILRGYRLGEKIIRHAMVKVSEGGTLEGKIDTSLDFDAEEENLLSFEIERF